MPEGPAVAGAFPLHGGAEAMDRALLTLPSQGAVGPDLGPHSPTFVKEQRAGLENSKLDDGAERHARLRSLRARRLECGGADGADPLDALAGGSRVVRVALDTDPAAAEPLGHGTRRTGTEERIEHHVTGIGRGEQNAMQQRLGLLR